MNISERCRQFEKNFPLIYSGGQENKNGWTRWKQYSTPDELRKNAKMFWNFGVSREIRYEIECRRENKRATILTFDPTPLSKNTTDRANRAGFRITHHMKAYDSVAGQTKKFYDPVGDGKCFQLDEPAEYKDVISVKTTNLKEISKQYGRDVDIIKLDVEGRWYEMLSEILDLSLPVKVVLCECEMNIGDTDTNFERLNKIVEKFEADNYKVWINRILQKENIELVFTKDL